MSGPGSGSILIAAAESGNPDVVAEILNTIPNSKGETARERRLYSPPAIATIRTANE